MEVVKMNNIFKVKIKRNQLSRGLTLVNVTEALFKYLNRKKISGPTFDDDYIDVNGVHRGPVNYKLRNGLDMTLLSGDYSFVNSKLTVQYSGLSTELEMVVTGDFETLRKSVDSVKNKYPVDIILEYIGNGVEFIEGERYKIQGTMIERLPEFGIESRIVRFEAIGIYRRHYGSGIYLGECTLKIPRRNTTTYKEKAIYIGNIKEVIRMTNE